MDDTQRPTVEERVTRLEARDAARGIFVSGLLICLFAGYLLWSAGVLRFGPSGD